MSPILPKLLSFGITLHRLKLPGIVLLQWQYKAIQYKKGRGFMYEKSNQTFCITIDVIGDDFFASDNACRFCGIARRAMQSCS